MVFITFMGDTVVNLVTAVLTVGSLLLLERTRRRRKRNKLRRNECQVSISIGEVGRKFWPGPAVEEHHGPL